MAALTLTLRDCVKILADYPGRILIETDPGTAEGKTGPTLQYPQFMLDNIDDYPWHERATLEVLTSVPWKTKAYIGSIYIYHVVETQTIFDEIAAASGVRDIAAIADTVEIIHWRLIWI